MMTKKQAKADFDRLYPRPVWISRTTGHLDSSARAEAWNNYTDALCKGGAITTRQYETWTHPWKA
jgi:hypothetical protein